MNDALERTFDAWWARQASGDGLRVSLPRWSTPVADPTGGQTEPSTLSLSLRKVWVYADRYTNGALDERRLTVSVRLREDDASSGPRWQGDDGAAVSTDELASLTALAIRQAYFAPARLAVDPGFYAFGRWALAALDADDGGLADRLFALEPRAGWWWGRVLDRAGHAAAAERAWVWQARCAGEAHDADPAVADPEAAVRCLLALTQSKRSTPADRLGLCGRAQRVFDRTDFRHFDLQTRVDLARAAALIEMGYRVAGREVLVGVAQRLVANPSAGLVGQALWLAALAWRGGGSVMLLRLSTAVAGGLVTSATARYKLNQARRRWRWRSRRPRLPRAFVHDPADPAGPPAVRRVALVRLDRIGDLVCMEPIVRRVRDRYPDADLDLYVTAGLAPIAARLAPAVRVVEIDWKHPKRFAGQLRGLADTPAYDVLIDLLEPDVPRHARLDRTLRADARVGFDSPARKDGFTHRIPRPEFSTHLIDRTARLLRPLGLAVPDTTDWRPRLCHEPADRAAGRAALGDGPWVGLHVGAGWRFKRWYPDRWAEVARGLIASHGVRLAVFAGPHPAEGEMAEQVARRVGDAATVLRPTLDALPGQLSALDLLLANDSGPMHLALALDTPTVVAWGPGDLTLFRPRGPVAVVARQSRDANGPQDVDADRSPMGHAYEDVPCLVNVTADAVLDAARRMLDTHRPPPPPLSRPDAAAPAAASS
ncbi:MAG: glycosyltransferase family 9 protein [Planctomycetota bacterium]